MRIGIFGGTFDPPHLTHVSNVENAMNILKLDRIDVVPSAIKFFHEEQKVASPNDRLIMTKLSFDDHEHVRVSDLSLVDDTKKYAVDVMEYYHNIYPHAEFWWIMGSDILPDLKLWKNAERLTTLCRFAVFPRHGADINDALLQMPLMLSEKVDVMPGKANDCSSTLIKQMLFEGRDVSDYIDSRVLNYILQNQIYDFQSPAHQFDKATANEL